MSTGVTLPRSSFWLDAAPLVLASGSVARRALLEAAGIPLEILKAPVDETAIANSRMADGETPRALALTLARAKSVAAAEKLPGRVILTADQTLDHDGTLMMKARSRAEAATQLRGLRGRAHCLHAAACLSRNGSVIWADVTSATLTMRDFSDAFLQSYLDAMGESVCDTVGGYQLEALGPHLFEAIAGDHATILGLPLQPLLAALRQTGLLLA